LFNILVEDISMKLSLSQYPAAIAQAAQTVNELDHQIAEARQHLARLEGNADMVVAFETALKNDNQRKARRFEVLQVNQEYQRALDTINRLTTDKANALARLEHLRNEFSVAKLEARMAIAQQLLGLESRELVGL
jgi:mevalonate kinase